MELYLERLGINLPLKKHDFPKSGEVIFVGFRHHLYRYSDLKVPLVEVVILRGTDMQETLIW